MILLLPNGTGGGGICSVDFEWYNAFGGYRPAGDPSGEGDSSHDCAVGTEMNPVEGCRLMSLFLDVAADPDPDRERCAPLIAEGSSGRVAMVEWEECGVEEFGDRASGDGRGDVGEGDSRGGCKLPGARLSGVGVDCLG
jgi:hypothetical protein